MVNQSWQHILSHVKAIRENYVNIRDVSDDGIALFGAGATGIDAVRYLQSKVRVKCFIDNSVQKQGTILGGVPVIAPNDPLAQSLRHALITSKSSILEISSQLKDNSINNLPFLAFYVSDNLDKYEFIRNNIFVDDLSRLTLDGLLLSMLTGDLKYCTEIMTNGQYFCIPHFQDVGEDYFVDAGAYVGDTTELFIWRNQGVFKHIYMFEPGLLQFGALKRRIERLVSEWAFDADSISMVNAGLAEHDGKACFGTSSNKLAAMAITDNDQGSADCQDTIDIRRLDSYLMNGDRPATFIKADIEGMEVEMLRGAFNTIKRHKPKLAISVYHHPWDLFDVIEAVTSCIAEYRFSLRHHSTNLSETVLYGWVESKR